MVKEDVVCIHAYTQWSIFSHEEEGNPDICDNMAETWGHYIMLSEIS